MGRNKDCVNNSKFVLFVFFARKTTKIYCPFIKNKYVQFNEDITNFSFFLADVVGTKMFSQVSFLLTQLSKILQLFSKVSV